VYRQLGWVNALRLHLRRQPERWAAEVAPFLDPAEADYLRTTANPPAQLLLLQSQALRDAEGLFDPLQHRTLLEDLRELTNLQGGCERIKNTPFPRQYAFSSIVFVWLFVALLPLGVQGEFEKLGHGHYWLTVPFSVLVSWVFVTIELVGHISENPFENQMNDVPMTALCRTIEIDLRQMLGETDLPPAVQPVNGILY
jgi:putative membrane protein